VFESGDDSIFAAASPGRLKLKELIYFAYEIGLSIPWFLLRPNKMRGNQLVYCRMQGIIGVSYCG